MNRRGFLGFLAALPGLGFLRVEPPQADPASPGREIHSIKWTAVTSMLVENTRTGEFFFIDRDGWMEFKRIGAFPYHDYIVRSGYFKSSYRIKRSNSYMTPDEVKLGGFAVRWSGRVLTEQFTLTRNQARRLENISCNR